MALPIVGLVVKFFMGSWLKNTVAFFVKNWKLTAVLIAIGVVFYGGIRYERDKKDKEIAGLIKLYEDKKKERENEIEKKIEEIEKSTKEAADKLQGEKKAAEVAVKKLQEAYVIETTRRATRIKELQEKLKGTLSESQKKELEKELAQLKLTYTLSPIAIETINGFVREYAK